MSAPHHPHSEIVYAGSRSLCVRLPAAPGRQPERYGILAHVDQRRIAEIIWHPRLDRYVLKPTPETVFDSAALSEIALWLRKLTRRALDVRMRTTGTL
jgi:hypothetical protein